MGIFLYEFGKANAQKTDQKIALVIAGIFLIVLGMLNAGLALAKNPSFPLNVFLIILIALGVLGLIFGIKAIQELNEAQEDLEATSTGP